MATLTYQGVPIQILRTLEFYTVPEMNEDTDYELTRTRISVQGIINPFATQLPQPFPPVQQGNLQTQQRLGTSMQNLQTFLSVPRGTLVYTVGVDTVISVPAAGKNCDAKNGPIVADCKVWQVTGDRTAWVIFTVDTWAVGSSPTVLANRWTMHETLDDRYYTAYRYIGRATFRVDLLAQGTAPPGTAPDPDQFRDVLLPPVPAGFQRHAVEIILSNDGRELAYEVADQLENIATGANNTCVKVEGVVTVGSESELKTLKEYVEKAVGTSATAPMNPFWLTTGGPIRAIWHFLTGGMTDLIASFIPTVSGSAVVRAYGRPGARRFDLMKAAIASALDRLDPIGTLFGNPGNAGGRAFIVSAFLSASLEDKWVEFRCTVLTGVGAIVDGTFNALRFEKWMKMDGNINGPAGYPLGTPFTEDGGVTAAPLNSNATRETTSKILAAALGIVNKPPATVLTLAPNVDQPLL